jgi:hypothetical protein
MPKRYDVRAAEDARPTDRWSWIVASLLAFFFLSASAYIATKRLFWFDEIFTVTVARLPDLATVWKALGDYVDSAPIGYHILARAAYNLSGQWDVSIRLLSAAAMAAAMLIVFDCARRLTNGLSYFGNQQGATRAGLALEDAIVADGKLYITSPAAFLITEVRYYSGRPNYYVELRPAPWQLAVARYDPSVVYWNMDDLRRHASETAVLLTTPEFTAEITRAGIRATAAPGHPEVLHLSAD